MPQMNPMWWFSLFIIFVLTLILTNSINYFYFNYSPLMSKSLNMQNKKSMIWKW